MTRTWLEPSPVTVPAELAAAVGGHPLVAEALVRRGLTTHESARAYLDPDAYTPAPPEELPGLTLAAERLEAAIRQREPICVWGDFDVDGQTATTALASALADLDASVTYHIPVRESEGHGVSLPILQRVIDAGARVILTCDTGISAVEAAAVARSRGVDFIITDHHDLPAALPDAYAIVNPKLRPPAPAKRPPGPSALSTLPGAGVAYKLAEALYSRAGRPEAAAALLDLVALGIVADLAVLSGDARYLLQRGLAVLRETPRLGLQVLMENAELNPAHLGEEHISFVIAPRLYDLGRLAVANVAVEFLTLGMSSALRPTGGLWLQAQGARASELLARARILAADLEVLNARRKLLCDQVYAAAAAQLQRDPSLTEAAALVLAGPGWHPGVVGIVASRLVERYGKPTVLLSLPPPGAANTEPARGSARSVEGVNITAALAAHAELLSSFGGHPMAAGLSLPADRIAALRRGLSNTVATMLQEAGAVAGLEIDGYIPLSDLTLDFAADLERLAPFGPGNRPLTLVSRDLTVREQRDVGRDGSHLLLVVEDAWGTAQEVIWWNGAGEMLPEARSNLPSGRFHLAYTVRSNDYRGVRGIQVAWVDAHAAEAEVEVQEQVEVVDYRGKAGLTAAIRQLQTEPGVVFWGEGLDARRWEIRALASRLDLAPAPRLAILTSPPGPAELRAALARVKPQQVYLFGVDPGLDAPDAFLRRLAGTVKHALSVRGGRVRVAELAAATAAREGTARQGLLWLAARGHIAQALEDGDEVGLIPGDGISRAELARASARLEALLAETAAYRAYFATADKERLVR